uniref:O-acyltransferase like n=1 Tax=Cyclopterus lumpus TaxID=8103 RepID=A0A8C2XBK5_CYCLU
AAPRLTSHRSVSRITFLFFALSCCCVFLCGGALSVYDAFGKMGSNVKGGNANQPGLLQQCRSAHGTAFSGQYCQVFLRQVKQTTSLHKIQCHPDSCQSNTCFVLLVTCFTFLTGRLQLGQNSLIPPLPPILVNHSTQEMIMTHCLSNTVAPDASDVTCLSVYDWMCHFFTVSHACVLLSSTFLHFKTSLIEYRLPTETRPTPTCFPQGCVQRCLQAFSLQTTSQGVFSTSSSITGGGYSSLNGIRVLSLLWIICGHSAQFPVINNLDNYKDWKKTVESNPLHVLTISGPVFLAVDTFLLIGGLLSARSLLGSIDRAEDKLSPSLVAGYLFRIQPLHLFIMCLTIGLISVIQWGPYWFPFMDTMMDCKTYWWANLLLISNLLPVHEICIPWTWYLSLDFQCYATTPLGVFVVVAGGLLLMTTSEILKADPLVFVFCPSFCRTSENYVLSYYVRPHTRYGPFLIGILTGIYLTTKKDQLLKQKWQAALGWFCCLSVMATVVGLAYILRETPTHLSVPHALYQGLHRPLWALAVTWIILACEEGYGGFIKTLLSLGFWVPLSNISFACYLTHPVFIILYIGLQETPIHYTDINFMYLFLGHLLLTLVVSYVFTVLVEKPYLLLKWSSK